MTHDYEHHGTTSLFAALEVASGEVHGRCFRRHRHREFIAFLESLAKRCPRLELYFCYVTPATAARALPRPERP